MDLTYRSTASCLRMLALSLIAIHSLAPAIAQTINGADVPGPDGILYPDWRGAGVPGGIPTNLPVRNSITAFGGYPDDALDDTAALEAAVASAAAQGGGVVTLPAGTFILSRPVLIRHSNIVLRGAGQAATKIEFRYQPAAGGVTFFQPAAGVSTLYANSWIEIHANPANLERLEILAKVQSAGDATLQSCVSAVKTEGNWGATFSLSMEGSTVMAKAGGAGAKQLVARATYPGNIVWETRLNCTLINSMDAAAMPRPSFLGAITFCGKAPAGNGVPLKADGLRGQRILSFDAGHGFNVNDTVQLRAPATQRWNAEVQNACPTDVFRYCQYKVVAVSGNTVTLNQPLRIDYPVIDGSNLRAFTPISRCGVEHLSLEQKHDVWTSGIIFSWAWECWSKGIKVTKAGRFPLYFSPAKWCEVRYGEFNDAWYKGGGGTAYVGFEKAYDCLMENVTTRALRHAPLVQWSASGNVIRNSTFVDSDAQWHAGWANENLLENCTVLSNRGNGAYGAGMYSSPPDDVQHGPNGPRNAVYNCDVSSPLDSLWLGGMNRGWLILHNRFAADLGAGVYARMNSGGHIIENNVFALAQAAAGVQFIDPDCDGVELTNNVFTGLADPGDIALGAAAPEVDAGNVVSDNVNALPFSNNGFEAGLQGWDTTNDGGQTTLSAEGAKSGAWGVKITDTGTTTGSSLFTPFFDVLPGKVYSARCSYRFLSGESGAGLYLIFYNAGNAQVSSHTVNLEDTPDWALADVQGTAPATAVRARAWLHSYSGATPVLLADDFRFGVAPQAIPNPGFELDTYQWSLNGDNGMSAVTPLAAKNGGKGLRVSDTQNGLGSSCTSQALPVTAGKTYQVRYWCRRISGSPGSDGVGVYLLWYNSSGTNLSSNLLEVPADADWKEYLTRAEAPAEAVSARVLIRSYSNSVTTVDFDDFTFLELPPRPATSTPSIFEWQRNPVYAQESPSFENGLAGWSNTDDYGMSAVIAQPDGTYCLRVTDGIASGGSSLRSSRFPVFPGATYQLSFRSRIISSSGIGVYLIFLDAEGDEVDSYSVNLTGSAWATQTLSRTAPASAASAEIWIHSYKMNKVVAELDDFSLRAVLP